MIGFNVCLGLQCCRSGTMKLTIPRAADSAAMMMLLFGQLYSAACVHLQCSHFWVKNGEETVPCIEIPNTHKYRVSKKQETSPKRHLTNNVYEILQDSQPFASIWKAR